MENEKNIRYKIIGVITIILLFVLILINKAHCEEKDYVAMSKLDILKELLEAKHEIVDLKQELNSTNDLLIMEKERTKMLANKLIQDKDAMNTFLKPISKKSWKDYFHLYAKLNYLTNLQDLTRPGFLVGTGLMAGGFHNLWFNLDFEYNYLLKHDMRMNTGIMLWY